MAQSRPAPSLQPRPRVGPTFNNTLLTPEVTATAAQVLQTSSSVSRQPSPKTTAISGFDHSERATAALIRRVLCPHVHSGSTIEPAAIDKVLPPLTSSNEIDVQLYAIIAIVVKEVIQSWYGKMTPDQGFVEEVVRIVAHCTRALEGRLRSMDLEGLILDEMAELVESHILAYRISHPATRPPLAIDPHVIYHNLNPHPALSPIPNAREESTVVDQAKHEMVYRQLLVQGALAVLLPTEDLENNFLRTLVADVIAETILGSSIGGKATEGWFIWGNIIKIVDVVKARIETKAPDQGEMEIDSRSRLEIYGLLSDKGLNSTRQAVRWTDSRLFRKIVQYLYLTFLIIRSLVLSLALGLVATYTPSAQSSDSSSKSRPGQGMEGARPMTKPIEPPKNSRPILDFKIFSLVSVVLNMPGRMPWLTGSFSLLQHLLINGPLGVGGTNGFLNQYLHYLLTTHLHPPTLLPPLLFTLRKTIFPNSSLHSPPSPAATTATTTTPPSPAEQLAIKRSCARSLISLFPLELLLRFFSAKTEEEVLREVESKLLDVWSDGYLNRHVAYQVLELFVVRVLPEMAEKGVSELMERRLGEGT